LFGVGAGKKTKGMERARNVSHQPVPVLKNIRPGVAMDDIKQTQHLF